MNGFERFFKTKVSKLVNNKQQTKTEKKLTLFTNLSGCVTFLNHQNWLIKIYY